MIGYKIESEEVGTGFFYGVAVSLQSIRISGRKQLSATMSQAFVQVGMQVIGDVGILVHQRHGLLIDDEFISESVALCSLVVGISQVADGNALGAMFLTDPVGVRQVDADGRSRIFLSAQHGSTDDVGCNSLHFRLAEAGIYRRMVLKPLCVLADGLGALGSLQVLIFHNTFPCTFHTERVTVYFDESIEEIHQTFMLFYPCDAVSVEILKITGTVELHEQVDDMLLPFVLGILLRLEQPGHDFADGLSIESIFLPCQFHYFIVALGQFGVESV